MSIHMDVGGGHTEHAQNEEYRDIDVDLSPSLIIKYFKIDLPLLAMLTLIVAVCISSQKSFLSIYASFSPQRIPGIRPPLRAPPIYPV